MVVKLRVWPVPTRLLRVSNINFDMNDYLACVLVADLVVGTCFLISRCFLPCKFRWKGADGSSLRMVTDIDNLKLK